MKLPIQKYSASSFCGLCNDTLKDNNKNLQIITIFLNDELDSIYEKLEENEFIIDNSSFGEIIHFSKIYQLHKENREVDYYLLRHSKYKEIYFIFTFNGISDLYRTLFGIIDNIPNVYYLWLPPSYFDNLKDIILKIEGSYMTYFHGKKVDMGKQECKRPMFYRDIEYTGDDAKTAFEEMRFVYGVLPQAIEFVIPNSFKFKINKRGYYTLYYGKVEDFLNNIIERFIEMVIKDNQEMESAKIDIKKENGREILETKQVIFEIEKDISFEEFREFLTVMEKNNFSVYNTKLEEGSVIFSSNVVDEQKGNIFSMTSDGKRFTIIPKYKSSFVSIVRFHRFLTEKIDQLTKIIY